MKALNNEIRDSLGNLNITLNSNGIPTFGPMADGIKWQRKVLPSNVTPNATLFTFNSLEVGKTYRISFTGLMQQGASGGTLVRLRTNSGATVLTETTTENVSTGFRVPISFRYTFQATHTSIDIVLIAGTATMLATNNTYVATWAELEELPLHSQTSQWT